MIFGKLPFLVEYYTNFFVISQLKNGILCKETVFFPFQQKEHTRFVHFSKSRVRSIILLLLR
mgnify:CR=1 FL=1